MRKGLALLTAAVMVFGLAACGGADKETDTTKEAAVTETEAAESETTDDAEATETAEATEAAEDTDASGQTFTVGFDAEFPPYGYMDENGEYVGFDLDLAAEVCKRQGWELKKQPINWDTKDMETISRRTGAVPILFSWVCSIGKTVPFKSISSRKTAAAAA